MYKEKKMKKITTLIISLLMVVLTTTAIGCGNKNSTSKITFDANGGVAILNSAEVSSITVAKDSSFELPTAKKDGYTFNYWQYDNNQFDKNSFDYKKDITLVANYTANTYTVKFSGVSPAITDMSVTYDAQYTLPTPTKAGYEFKGWKIGETDVALTGNWNIASDTTLTANFAQVAYSVQYNLDGGAFATGIVPFSEAKYGDNVQLYNPTKEGYVFKGWKVDGSETLYSNTISWNFTTNITFVAVWEEDKVINLTLDAGEGTFGTAKTKNVTLEKGAKYDLSKYGLNVPNNKRFDGWYFGEVKIDLQGSWNYGFGNNVTLTAKYVSEEITTFTLILDGGALLNGYPATYEFYKGTNYNISAYVAEKSGYRFLGWYLSTDANKTVIATTGAWTAGNVTLVAKYEWIDNRTITLNAGEGTLNGINVYTFEQGKAYNFSATTATAPAGWEFIGWYLGETKVESSGNSFNMGNDTAFTLVAKYKYVGDVVITLNAGEGVLEGQNTITFANGSAYDLTPYVPTKAGDYRFTGWLLNGTKIANVGNWNFGNESEYTLVAEYEWVDYRMVNIYAADVSGNEPTHIKDIRIEQGTNYDISLTNLGYTHPQGLTLKTWFLGEDEIPSTGVWNYGDSREFVVVGLFYLAGDITINFDAGNGTASITSYTLPNYSVYDLSQIVVDAPNNYVFEGWYFSGDPDKEVLPESELLIMPTLDPITLVAKYAYTGTIKITLVASGTGSVGGTTTYEVEYGKAYDFSATTVTAPESTNPQDPFTFAGWYVGDTKIEASGTWNYNFGEDVYEITITAMFTNLSNDGNWGQPV